MVLIDLWARVRLTALGALLLWGLLAGSGLRADTRLLRFPDLHGDQVVFTYGGDLWTAPASGGVAARLTSHPGLERYPRFSPDGQWIAFTGQYDGDEQVYVIPAAGGVPRQLTFYPAFGPLQPWAGCDNQVLGWTPDGRSILFRSFRDADGVLDEGSLYTVRLEGGPAHRLPVAGTGAGAISPDGAQLAYEPVFRDSSNWKRYAGGQARGLHLLELATGAQHRMVPSARNELDPMWVGGEFCFTSDRDGTLDLYASDPAKESVRRLTHGAPWDVRWPSTDHVSRIVYERDGELRIFDLKGGTDRGLAITVPTDGGASRPTQVEAEVEGWSLSPKGERALMVARGEVFTVPIEKGPVRNLTHCSRAHARLARWSPDGRTIAFVWDRSGEEQIHLVNQDGKTAPRQLTTALDTGVRALSWAPDGGHLAVTGKDGRIFVVNMADGRLRVVARDAENGEGECAWAPDGAHLALTLTQPNDYHALFIWSAADGRLRQVTSSLFPVRFPAWDPQGRFLFYLSPRNYGSRFSSLEFEFSTGGNWGVFAMALRKGTPHLFPPESDEVEVASPKATQDAGEPRHLVIDWDGLVQRVVRVPVAAGSLSRLEAFQGFLLFKREALEASGQDPRFSLCHFDLARRKEAVLADEAEAFAASADGSHALVRKAGAFFLMEARPDAKEHKPVATTGLLAEVIPADEWAEVFDEVWRGYRDGFYARNMHGVDWKAIRDRFRPLLKDVTHRSDLSYVLLEMLGELNVGHAFLGGGDSFQPERPKVALPGAQFEVDPLCGLYRIKRIYQGQNEELRYRSPLTEPGVDARVGDYVLAIDGQELKGSDDPYRLLRHKTGPVTLTLNGAPSTQGARQVTYTPIESEAALRYLDFVLGTRERVQLLGAGRVGYLHLPDMDEAGLAEFIKWYYPQVRCQALVVDVRANHGGNISQLILERLGRKLMGLSFKRDAGQAVTYPGTVFLGPMVCLMNETTSSDGELFAHHFRQAGLGPLVGLRTWGGAVGYYESGPLKDGGFMRVPMVGSCGPDGQWIIEGQGVRPDVEVENDPRAQLEGRDPQLERAVAEVLRRLEAHPEGLPERPVDPVKIQ